ncbi:U5 small nuclear ribonucleoprotein 40 kDa protein [Strongyloides ratti]|uniref:U5 small nuclear ribonucleoprotein 40 kDa protein n=1 Tax=Strongyloides ratti TaxID=34506 RepID=A0A090LHT8_STRRB|nr:U5 small nuclear ribonucleoprotein 40 kDa protein [Strongyloides ratti]CEF69307.1 U5 small nuclear ribonucleoprotein 40 kDa protein [Strongyloides ratti]
MAQVSMIPRTLKRPLEDSSEIQLFNKRPCQEVSIIPAKNGEHEVKRTSNLMAPNMLLLGHEAEIFTARFAPTGDRLATAGFDRAILLWDVYGECKNISTFRGHKHSVMDIKFSTDTSCLASASADKTVRVWDMDTGKCYRNFVSHTDIVNSVSLSRRGNQLIASGGDDGRMLIHDFRQKLPCKDFLNHGKFQFTAVAFNDSAEQVFCAGIDNDIHCWDLRKEKVLYSLHGHNDTITDIMLSPDGNYLLSNGMDICGTIWDVKPYCKDNRAVSFYVGHQHNFEKNLLKCAWSPDGRRISLGSSDGFHYIWNVQSNRVVYRLPGHQGSVNAVDFHPFEPIILSAGSDKQIFLGEISPD